MSDHMDWRLLFPEPGRPLVWIRREDVIAGSIAAGSSPAGTIQLVLMTSNSQITWWKQLRVVTPDERIVLGTSEFQDEVRRGAVIQLTLGELRGRWL